MFDRACLFDLAMYSKKVSITRPDVIINFAGNVCDGGGNLHYFVS